MKLPQIGRVGLTLLAGAATGVAVARARRSAGAIDFFGRVAVVVGGSRGLGLVIARQLGDEGARLALVARNEDELARAAEDLRGRGATVATYRCDIRQKAAVEETIQKIASECGNIDILINDAGIIQVGPLEHMTIADFENAMATHFWGPLYAIVAALPHLRRRTGARIVNISSIGGKLAVPHLLPYSASKFALTGLSEGLQAELAGEGIRVTTVSPGLMRTGSSYNAWFKGQHRREFAWFHTADAIPGMSMAAERAARRIVDACRYGDPELVLTLPAKAGVLLKALFPQTVLRGFALVSRVLPGSGGVGTDQRSGWQSVSPLAPSPLTRLADRAAVENNELPAAAR